MPTLFLVSYPMTKEFQFHPIRRILVPTDFSLNATGALRYAASLAARLRARILLLHSIHVPLPAGTAGTTLSDKDLHVEEVRVRLQALKQDLRTEFPTVETEVFSTLGFAVEEIIGFCTSRKADLIVMGTKGAHGLAEILIGSNTAEVIAKANCPVLAVPANADPGNIKKIAFATNYADNDFQSIFLLTEIFKPWNPEIVVVHAGEMSQPDDEDARFNRFRQQVTAGISYDKFRFRLIAGEAEQALSDFTKEIHADVLSVSTRRRSLFERLISRSVTRKFAYHTDIPLLAFHAELPAKP